jgi:light-harvesting complex I chlorophyll a/b binding protein 4
MLSKVGVLSLALVAACADAFMAPVASRAGSSSSSSSSLKMSEEAAAAPVAPAAPKAMSKSLPFILKPKANLSGLVGGEAEFDPLSLSELLPLNFLVESEIKHGRVAMLAVLGYFVEQVIHLPGDIYQSSNPLEAVAAVGPSPMLQIFFGMGALEWVMHNGKMTMEDMHSDGHVPGDFGFDPMGLAKNADAKKKYALNEIKNGRLAMLAAGHLVSPRLRTIYFMHASILTYLPVPVPPRPSQIMVSATTGNPITLF